MEITLNHAIEYEVVEKVAVEDVIKSLQANARLLRDSATLISSVVPGLELETKFITVSELVQQSPLKELFAVALVMTYQKELEAEVPALIESLTGFQISDSYDTLITVVVMLIAVHGISKAIDLLFPGRDKKAVDETQENLLHRAAKMLGVGVETLRVKLGELFIGRRRRGLLHAAQQVFAPTRGQEAAIRSRGETLIPREVTRIAQSASGLPVEGEEDKPKTSSEIYRDKRIILHAMDIDSQKRGWAGVIPDIFDGRIPMDLEKNIKPQSIFGKQEVRGDILLVREEDEKGDMRPKAFLLLQVDLK